MEYEFDKEIDSLLRQARPETIVFESFNAHVDADEISLFAENALTQKARESVTEHLADCAKCRKILSNVILLNSEELSENLHTEETKASATETAIPWYRKLFVFPNLAYTMGGLTILLAGMIGYVTLQSYNESKSASIAQMERSVERPRGTGGVDSDGESVTLETYSANANLNAPLAPLSASNTAANAANTSADFSGKSNVPTTSTNSVAAAPSALTEKDRSASPPNPAEMTADAVKNKEEAEKKEAQVQPQERLDTAAQNAKPNYPQNSVAQSQPQIVQDSPSVQTRRAQNLPPAASPPIRSPQLGSATAKKETNPETADDSRAVSERTRTVGSRDFTYRNGVWYDKSYKQQKTINISRNSDDYKKLDSGLRSITDNLGGTVVIIWNSKAYRIQ